MKSEKCPCHRISSRPLRTAKKALERIASLDFAKAEQGGDDFYSGPGVFIQAWMLAHAALDKIEKAPVRTPRGKA
jgi:hypothetical protein